jgi:hypothetical protein
MDREIPPDVARALRVVDARQVDDGVWHGKLGDARIEIRAPWARSTLTQPADTDADADGM